MVEKKRKKNGKLKLVKSVSVAITDLYEVDERIMKLKHQVII